MSEYLDKQKTDFLLGQLERDVAAGLSLDASIEKMRSNPFGAPEPEYIKNAVDIFRTKAKMIVDLDTVETVSGRERESGSWYTGPDREDAVYWPPLKKIIEENIGDAVRQVDEASSQVIASLRPSGEPQIDVRGLVLGYVQSGKTTNFLSVIAKAADIGYRFFIVLTGITESLRSQTQSRIDSQLVTSTKNWYRLTTVERDFRDITVPAEGGSHTNASTLLSNKSGGGPNILAVVKKNATVLRKLNAYIKSAGLAAQECPILIIDDEADQASINVAKDDDQDPSAINSQIQQLLRNQKTAYIAYTATPFANILVNPNLEEDIYPRDFIHVLPKPKGYFGTEQIFGAESETGEFAESDGIDIIREIPSNEADILRPPAKRKNVPTAEWDPSIPGSLVEAVRWFVLASAARRLRGATSHSSMLIHTAMKTDAHNVTAALLKPEVPRLQQEFHQSPDIWENLWNRETALVAASEFENPSHTFEDLKPVIDEVFSDLKIVVDNSRSEERLDYDDEQPSTVIAIGGNTLSRGLTLEGLTCSYFVRNSTAYDTLLQMGRWFGFKNGYQDLQRIWMTNDLSESFAALSLVEQDLRKDFSRYANEQIDPMDFQARIRLHPGLEVTNRAKQRHMKKANVSFSGRKVQTILFNHKDPEWLRSNIDAARSLAKDLHLRQHQRIEAPNGTVVFRGVNAESIREFLQHYKIHEDAQLGANNAEALIKYITMEEKTGSIKEWSVSYFGRKSSRDNSTIDLSLGKDLNLITRSQMMNSKPGIANIKTLVGSMDRLNDAVLNDEQRRTIVDKVRADTRVSEDIYREAHDQYRGSDVGHLAIYAIDKDSKTSQPESYLNADGERISLKSRRKNLDAVDHVIGIGFFFPESGTPEGSVEYVCAIEPDEDTKARLADASEENLHSL